MAYTGRRMATETLTPPWSLGAEEILTALKSSPKGLSREEARRRREIEGANEIDRDNAVPAWQILLRQFTSPLVLILIGASFISISLGERTETVIILIMVLLGGLLAFWQEYRSEQALRTLRKKLTHRASVLRGGHSERINATDLVTGDVVELDLGTIIPADLRLFQVEDLEIDESVLTGESAPVVKTIAPIPEDSSLPQDQINIAFSGTHVVQGSGLGVVVSIGSRTEIGRTASLLSMKTDETEFQKGIAKFGNFLLKITIGMAVIVAVILGLVRGQWSESILFALALAVGISPELLPVIVTINLSRGALKMSKKHVLIKRLIAIEDLGNADVFCTDKTGTLTVGKLRVRQSISVDGTANDTPLAYAALCIETNRKGHATNPIDEAILEATGTGALAPAIPHAVQHDIVSFDFTRRRMSCIVSAPKEKDRWMVVKGATTEVIDVCTSQYAGAGKRAPITANDRAEILARVDHFHDQGHRLVAIARRPIASQSGYSPKDEKDLELLGFVLVSDAPKESAKSALASLKALNTRIVILTGDNERVTRYVAEQLDFTVTGVITGDDVETMSDAQLKTATESTNVFARITPGHKLRIIQAFKKSGHTVGYMGDGVNDAPALRAADVGISFDSAVDVAKEAAGVILMQKKLSVLADGIREGRRTFVNTRTYLYSTISSNFGNMLSVAGAALLLPFIPLLPSQILLLNLLSDVPMLSISSDRVPDEELAKPKKWDIGQISNFMYFFGTISSLADYATFAVLLFVARADVTLFRSSWFLESMLTEIVVIFLLRTRRLSFANRPGYPVLLSSLAVICGSFFLVQSPLGQHFELVLLPGWILWAIVLIVAGYAVLTEFGKLAYYRLRGTDP